MTLLGGFGAIVDGDEIAASEWRHRRAVQLVKILALTPGHQLFADQVIDLLWPDLDAVAGAANLRKAAHFARRALGAQEGVILAEGRLALFSQAEVSVDSEDFERAADAALRPGDSGLLVGVIERYRGDLLPEDLYEDWAAEPRERLRRKYVAVLRRSGEWERLADEEPHDEQAHREVVRMWLARGNRAAALRQYTRMKDSLARDLGVRPSAESLALWSELRATAAPAPTSGPLVGREDEIDTALTSWASARAGRGGVILVSGEAGVGKTRFCDELVRYASAEGAVTVRVAARSDEATSPFGVVFRALDSILTERPELIDLLGGEARRRLELPPPATSAGLSWGEAATPGIERQRLFSSVSQLVVLAAGATGLVLEVEDIHDADEGSLQLLAYLGEMVAQERVLVVLTHRSEVSTPALPRLRGRLLEKRGTVDLRLAGLSRHAVEELVTRVSGRPVPASTIAEIWALAGGNAFYTEELAAAIGTGGDVHVPERVYEVIWARLDRLDADVRLALRQMAVTGDNFTADELMAVLGVDESTAFAHLDLALRVGVIHEEGTGYRFRHALIRRALDRSLPRHRRRQIHSETAGRLAAVGTDPARVAYHLLMAGEDAAAVGWLERAALAAAGLGAYSEGLRLVTDAVARATPADRARLLALRADMLHATGDPASASAYDAALATASPEARPRLWVMKARGLLAIGSVDQAREALTWALPMTAGDRIATMIVTGLVEWAAGDTDAAEQAAQGARDEALAVGHTSGLAEATELLGLVAHSRGQWHDRVRFELMDTLKRPEEVAGSVFDAHLCLAEYLLYGQQPYAEVIGFADDLRAIAARSGAGRGEAFALCLLGEAELLSGRLDAAVAHLERAAVLHEGVGSSAGQALSLQRLGEAAVASGDLPRAADLLDQAERVSQGSSLERHLLGRIHGTRVRAEPDSAGVMAVIDLAENRMSGLPICQPCTISFYLAASIAASRASDVARARAYLLTGEGVSARWPGGGWHAAVLEARAELAVAEGRVDDSLRWFGQAASSYDRAGQPLDAQRCAAAIGA